ncbi:MAG: hypothetical protein QNJ43_24980 [Breoghania sp.]|nr:hypothetical protein [Breoghania sp.]
MDALSKDHFVPAARLSEIGVSAIMLIDAETQRLCECGHSIVSLAVGEPNIAMEDRIAAAISKAIDDG